MSTTTYLEILKLAVTYGIPAIMNIIESWDDAEEITVEKIEALAALVKDPDEYDELAGLTAETAATTTETAEA
ncbi:MAG: peptidase M16 [Pseudomonadota bacterium]